MKEEEEVTNLGEEPTSVEKSPEKVDKIKKETKLKFGDGYSFKKAPAFDVLRVMRTNMERWSQSRATIQKQQMEGIRRKINAINFSSAMRQVRDVRLAAENSTNHVIPITEKIQNLLQTENWNVLVQFSTKYRELVERDEKLQEYVLSSHFWTNLDLVSFKLISLPLKPADDLLEELAKSDMSIDTIKKLATIFSEDELLQELQDEFHKDYMFRTYLLKLLNSYNNHPEEYQLLIPSQFLILEGTLSETFRVDENGMAAEIKKRMNLFWDILYALYLHKPINISALLYNQISLTNIKGMFKELTKNSRKAERINRNGVLHGRSHPDDWREEDFHLLTQLLYSSLYMRRTIGRMLEDLAELSADDLLNTIPLNEYRETLIEDVLPKISKMRDNGQAINIEDIQQRLEAKVIKELKKISNDEKTVKNLIMLMNIKEIAEDPRFKENEK